MSVVNTNVNAQAAQNSLQVNSRSLANAMQQLSTGKRINAARDDAAGLAISTRMTADLRGMSMAIKNSNDGISMMQTAEGALGEITNMLQRMRELAVQSSTGSMSSANRKQLQAEFDQLVAEIDNVSKTTNFNGIKLLDGTAQGVRIQTGVNESNQVTVDINAASSKALGIQGYAIQGEMQSGRVGSLADIEYDDVLINGKEWALSTYTAGAAGDEASVLASVINENTGQTGVRATAYNVVKGFVPTVASFSEGDLQINGTDVKAAGSVEELVANINRDIGGITATLERDGTITLSNNTGEDIEIGGTDPLTAGFDNTGGLDGAGTYTGYVALESVDGSAIRLQARNPENGFSAGEGSLDDLARMGFNETSTDGSMTGQQVMWFNVSDTDNRFGRLTLDDNVKINGVTVGVSADGSAASKAAAINEISAETGVQATAFTEVVVSLDFDAADLTTYDDGTTQTFSINGTIIDLTDIDGNSTQASNLNDVVKAIEYYGPQGVKATATADGELLLTSDTGQNVTIVDTDSLIVAYDDTASDDTAPVGTRSRAGETGFTNAWQADDGNGGGDTDYTDGLADLVAAGAAEDTDYDDAGAAAGTPAGVTFGGRLKLSSTIGAEIRIEGDYMSLRKVGLTETGGSSGTVGGALNILTQDSAGRSITKIDSAIDSVAMERATLGAFQNRLTAAVDNLSSTYTNLSDARSRILDTDYAKVTTEMARAQIIQQAGTAMLAQANQQPQMVLGLLK